MPLTGSLLHCDAESDGLFSKQGNQGEDNQSHKLPCFLYFAGPAVQAFLA